MKNRVYLSLMQLEIRELLTGNSIIPLDIAPTQDALLQTYQGIVSGDIRDSSALPATIDTNGYSAALLSLKQADDGAVADEQGAERGVTDARQTLAGSTALLGSAHGETTSLQSALLKAQGKKDAATDTLATLQQSLKDLGAQQNQAPSPQAWTVNARTGLPSLEGVNGLPWQRFDLSPDGKTIATIRSDGEVALYDLRSAQKLQSFMTGLQDNRGIAWSPDSMSFAICGKIDARNDWKLQVWNAQSGTFTWQQSFGSTGLIDTHWSADGKIVSGAVSPGQSRISDAATGQELSRMALASNTHASALSPEGAVFYVEIRPGITAFDSKTGAALRTYAGISGEVWSIAASPDGKYLLGGGAEGELCLYDAKTGDLLSKIWGKGGSITGLEWNAAGTAFAVSRANMSTPGVTVFVLEGSNARPVQFIATPDVEATLLSARFARDGKTLLVNESSWGSSAVAAATLATEAQTATAASSPAPPDALTLQIQAAQADVAAAQATIDDLTTRLSAALAAEATDAAVVQGAQAELQLRQRVLDEALASFQSIDGVYHTFQGMMYEALMQTEAAAAQAAAAPAPAMEMVRVVPSLSFALVTGAYHVTYQNMPANMNWQITKDGQTNFVLGGGAIPEGSGTIIIDASIPDGMGQIILRDGVTDAVQDLHLRFVAGGSQILVGSPTPTLTLDALAYIVRADHLAAQNAVVAAPQYDALAAQLGTYPNLRREFEDQCVRLAGLMPAENAEALVRRGYPQLVSDPGAFWENVRGVQQDLDHALTLITQAASAAFGDLLALRMGQPVAAGDSVAQALGTNNPGVAWVLGMWQITPDRVRSAIRAHFDEAYQEAVRLEGIQQATVAQIQQNDIVAEQLHEAAQLAAAPTPWSAFPLGGYVLGGPVGDGFAGPSSSVSGDTLTPMTRESLTRIRDDAQKGLASASAGTDPRNPPANVVHFRRQLEAANYLLGLIPAGTDIPVIGDDPQGQEWAWYIERTTTDPAGEATHAAAPELAVQLRRELAGLWALHNGLTQARQEIIQQFSGIHSDIERRAVAAKIMSSLFVMWQHLGSLTFDALNNVPVSAAGAIEDFVVTPVIDALDAAGFLGKEISTGLGVDGLIQGAVSSDPLAMAVVIGEEIQDIVIDGTHMLVNYQQLAALNQITAAIDRLNAAIAKRLPLLEQAARGNP